MKFPLLLPAFLWSLTALAQSRAPQRFTAPLSGTVVLKDVDDPYGAQVFNLEMPEPSGDKKKLRAVKEQVERLFPRKEADRKYGMFKTTQALKPVVAQAFVADTFPGIPPDNYMAINTQQQAISVINSSIAVLDAGTGQMVNRKGLRSFSAAVGLNNLTTDYRYDPKVIYDPKADRFICVMLNSTNANNWIVLGFSQTSNPTGAWNFYKLYGDYDSDTTWFDYPTIAITDNEFFLSGNKIQYGGSWQAGFRKSVIYQVKKANGYSGQTLNYQVWDDIAYDGRFIRNLFPVKVGRSFGGNDQWFLSNRNFDVQNDTIFLIRIPDTLGSGSTTASITPLKSNLAYGVPPDAYQPDTAYRLATNDGRILGAFREGSQIQFVSTTSHPGGSAGIYHGIISNYNTSPSVSGALFAIDTLDMGYPNISCPGKPGGVNHAIISFNFSGKKTNPGLGAIYYDGSQYSEMTVVKSGDSSIRALSGSLQRWGDYTGSQIDWTDPGAVWIEGIYGRKDQEYGSYMAKLESQMITATEQPQQRSVAANLYPNPAIRFIRMRFTLEKDRFLSFAICNIQGQTIARMLEQPCKAGDNQLQFNTASLAPGVYLLKASDRDGTMVFSQRFVRE